MNDNKPETKTQALFDTKQAAKFLGVSVRTLKRWLKSGKLVPKIKGDKGRGKCDIFSEEQLKNVTPDEKTVSSTAQNVTPDEKTVSSTAEMVQPDEKTVSSTAEMVQPDARLVTGSESFALIPISTDGRKALVRVVNNLKESGNSIEYIDDESKNIAQGAVFIQPSSCIEYIDAESKNIAQSAVFIQPETFYSPKDKVSYAIWNKEIKIELNYNRPVITITNSEIFGCLINLDYRQIFESEDVVTGAEFSDFDRSVYDAIVTLCVAGNMVFSTEQIWRIICKNPSAKLTDAERIKIAKSIFHIGNFLLTILTDHKEKPEAWEEKKTNNGKSFKGERQYYTKLQTMYGARMLEFRFLAMRTVKYTRIEDGKEVTEIKSVPEKWQLLATPILYEYASKKAQIAAIPLEAFGFSKKREEKPAVKSSNHTVELTDFLAREIDTMKKRKKSRKPYSKIILLETLYNIDGIDNVQKDGNSIRQKKKYTRDKVQKILNGFNEKEMIKGYIFHEKVIGKSRTFYSVEILL